MELQEQMVTLTKGKETGSYVELKLHANIPTVLSKATH